MGIDLSNLQITVIVNKQQYTIGLNAIFPHSGFNIQQIPYPRIPFEYLIGKLQRGEIIRFNVDPAHPKYFGLTGPPNTMVTVFNQCGLGYLVLGKTW